MVEVPVVVEVLEIPDDFAGIGIEGQGRVVIEVPVVGPADQKLRRRRSDRRADVDQVQLRVVARHHPGADVLPFLERHPTPGLVARLAGGRNRAPAPQLRAGLRVVGGDHAAVGSGRRHAASSRDHLAVGDDRAGALHGGVLPVVQNLGLPRQPAGPRVEGEDVVVHARVDDERAVDRQVAVVLPEVVEDVFVDVLGHLPAMHPAWTPLLLGRTCPICSLVAPWHAGASLLSVPRGVSPRTPGICIATLLATRGDRRICIVCA